MRSRSERVISLLLEAGWLGCLVAVPLFVSRAVSLTFTADKVLLFRGLAELMAVAALLLWLRLPRLRPAPLNPRPATPPVATIAAHREEHGHGPTSPAHTDLRSSRHRVPSRACWDGRRRDR